jgi:hypothetical protein
VYSGWGTAGYYDQHDHDKGGVWARNART